MIRLLRHTMNEGTSVSLARPLPRRMSSVCRANGLGPEGGASLAAGLARNCGTLKELVVADNRMGPRVATLVAATMHGGTTQCLRGFGCRAASKEVQQQHHQDRRSSEAGGDDNAAPPFERGQRSALPPAEKNDGGASGASGASGAKEPPSSRPISATEKSFRRANSGDNAQPVSSTSTRQTLSGLQRTSALASPTTSNAISRSTSTLSGEAGVGAVGSGGSEPQLLSTSDAPTMAASAFEEDLGRPQTAGTASG